MFDPKVSDVQFSGQLSDLSVSWQQKNDAFVYGNAFPVVNRDTKTGQYIELDRADFYRNDIEERTGSEEPPIVGHGLSRQSYNCRVYHGAGLVDDIEANASAPPYQGMEAKTRQLMGQHMINADVKWQSAYFTTSVWTTDLTGVASGATAGEFNQWSDASGNPIADIDARKEAMLALTGFEPNVLILGYAAWLALKENAVLTARWQSGPPAAGAPAILNEQIIAGLLGLDRIVVAKATQTTSNKGAATDVFAMIVGTNDGLLVYSAPSPGLDVPTAGYTFQWTGFLGTGTEFPVFTGRKSFNFADWVAVFASFDFRIVSADLGVFFSGITS